MSECDEFNQILEAIRELGEPDGPEAALEIEQLKELEDFIKTPLYMAINTGDNPNKRKCPIKERKENIIKILEDLGRYFPEHQSFKKLINLIKNSSEETIIKLSKYTF
jgi:hypothetical protein